MEKWLNYEIRQIDAWQEEEGCWIWNTSWHITNVSISASVKDLERALLYRMRKAGIISRPGPAPRRRGGDPSCNIS